MACDGKEFDMFKVIWDFIKKAWKVVSKLFLRVCEFVANICAFFSTASRQEKLKAKDAKIIAVSIQRKLKDRDYNEVNCLGLDNGNDYEVANCLFDLDKGEVASIYDIEYIGANELDAATKERFGSKSMLILS